jgi:hypothetical protein
MNSVVSVKSKLQENAILVFIKDKIRDESFLLPGLYLHKNKNYNNNKKIPAVKLEIFQHH